MRFRTFQEPTEKKSTWAKLKGAVSSQNDRPKYDNTNINIIQMNDTLVACTETPHAWCIDPHNSKPIPVLMAIP